MSRIIDLTIPLAPGVGHPMFRKVHIAPFHVHEIHRRSNADLYMAIHTATHIDAPYHFVADGATIDRVSLDQVIGEGALFSVEPIARERHRFTVAELQGSLRENRARLRGKIAVVATGWSNRAFADAARYFRDSPTLTPEAVPVAEQAMPVHRVLLGQGIPIVENCIDLVQIPDGPHTLYAIPLKIRDESGAPARAFALVEN